jgi:hypothetical protein
MGKIERVGSELRKVSQKDFRQTRESLDDFIKNESQLTEEFGNLIQWSNCDLAPGKAAPAHELKRS